MPQAGNCCSESTFEVPSKLHALFSVLCTNLPPYELDVPLSWNGSGWQGSRTGIDLTVRCEATGLEIDYDIGCDSGMTMATSSHCGPDPGRFSAGAGGHVLGT